MGNDAFLGKNTRDTDSIVKNVNDIKVIIVRLQHNYLL